MADNDTEPQSEVVAFNQRLLSSARSIQVSVLTAAIVNAAGRPFSIGEVLEVWRDVDFATNPNSKKPAYTAWLETKDDALAKVHK